MKCAKAKNWKQNCKGSAGVSMFSKEFNHRVFFILKKKVMYLCFVYMKIVFIWIGHIQTEFHCTEDLVFPSFCQPLTSRHDATVKARFFIITESCHVLW